MSQSSSSRHSISPPHSSSYYSRSPSPSRATLQKQVESILANDFYYKIAFVIFVVLTCITLSFSFPEDDPKTLKFSFLNEHQNSMQIVTQILFVISLIYVIAAYIIRRKSN